MPATKERQFYLLNRVWFPSKRLSVLLLALITFCFSISTGGAQDTDVETAGTGVASSANLLKNSSFEEGEHTPISWSSRQHILDNGVTVSIEKDNPFIGESCAKVDTRETKSEGESFSFGEIRQLLDPITLRGKTVRFRAAIRSKGKSTRKIELNLTVMRKLKDGTLIPATQRKMHGRPVASGNWQYYEIVSRIDDDADEISVGLTVVGKAEAWIDDASLMIMDDTEASNQSGSIFGLIFHRPFFVKWLWLVGITLAFFIASHMKSNQFQRFAFRFSFTYWLLYGFPFVISESARLIFMQFANWGADTSWATEYLERFMTGFRYCEEKLVAGTASYVLEFELVRPPFNGAGDTTFESVKLLSCFLLAVTVAFIWSGICWWQKSNQKWLKDFLQTYLRYYVALYMLSYGLIKAGFITTQFAQAGGISEFQLSQTYGESTLMGLLWTFMAASPMYTFFAGLTEVVGGLLLVFRRTTTLGALVVSGVMINVFMLNCCYNVPVKYFAFHLLVASIYLILPDASRLANVLFWNRSTNPSELMEPFYYFNSTTKWVHRAIKTALIVLVFGMPIFQHVKREIEHEHVEPPTNKHILINSGFRWNFD